MTIRVDEWLKQNSQAWKRHLSDVNGFRGSAGQGHRRKGIVEGRELVDYLLQM